MHKINRLKTVAINIFVAVYVKLFKRDNSIIVVGGWGGTRFADNSRFLYQYLYENKEKYGIKRIVWSARDIELCNYLNSIGYDSVLCGTRESHILHLKAGIHIVCAAAFAIEDSKRDDIDVNLSWGANKIQLWHGVGIKKVANASNLATKKKQRKRLIERLLSRGNWNDCFVLNTSKFHAMTQIAAFNLQKEQAFIAGYPRNCKCLKYIYDEEEVIKKVKSYRGSILYVPTFRDKNSSYIHPLELGPVRDFIKESGYVWIEKRHMADRNDTYRDTSELNTLYLDSRFDINVLFDYCSVVISDYSSALFDAIYKRIPTIMYTPDLAEYEKGSNGLWLNPREFFASIITFEGSDTANILKNQAEGLYFIEERIALYDKVLSQFYDNIEADYEKTWIKIKQVIKDGRDVTYMEDRLK